MSDVRPGLKMSELATASGVSAGTIKHYLREGLLGEGGDVVRTSRNMAWYPPEFVERVRLIKRLQEERFMPLRLIREVLADGPERLRALVEVEDRILEAAAASAIAARTRVAREEVLARYDVPANVLDRLAEIGVLTPEADGYGASRVHRFNPNGDLIATWESSARAAPCWCGPHWMVRSSSPRAAIDWPGWLWYSSSRSR